jgi:hypothetical protein
MLGFRPVDGPNGSAKVPSERPCYGDLYGDQFDRAPSSGRAEVRALTDLTIRSLKDGESRTDGALPVGNGSHHRLHEGPRCTAAKRCRSTTAAPTSSPAWPAWASCACRASWPRRTWRRATWCRCSTAGASALRPGTVVRGVSAEPPRQRQAACVRRVGGGAGRTLDSTHLSTRAPLLQALAPWWVAVIGTDGPTRRHARLRRGR